MPYSTSIGSGTWTPVLTAATPGNLSVAYTTQAGTYQQIGNMVICQFNIVTSSFTWTTASGNWQVTGLPFTVGATMGGWLEWQGVSKTNYTEVTPRPSNGNTFFTLLGSGISSAGTGQSTVILVAADIPSAGSVKLNGCCIFTI